MLRRTPELTSACRALNKECTCINTGHPNTLKTGGCSSNGLAVMLTLLDDCAFSGDEPFIGQQKPPVPGVHNSQGAGSPGREKVLNPECWPQIEAYVKDIVGHFRHDPRIQIWDLYNEPGNSGVFVGAPKGMAYDTRLEFYALSLMVNVFAWAREVSPVQPLTVAAWHVPDRSDCREAFTPMWMPGSSDK
ncbi:TPA: hypothetical protein QCI26_002857 [Enterobacter soli]|nr:hypothetical protein [Enterobacter soli]HDR2473150.1 hypothetical protein [Enterobacter soli]